ncbi:nitroreductase family protein [Roseateles saccharophilus]|uniref:Putative NAD(P)H nitroreductase n=1 Tax=Roseateles saccharophilus TaxID=304 RepID=A0A4R3UDQ0_ROSSA|nr:nitroreductase family protein [Roseateles saccharophilus]MDG0835557.1 nitroreductase [Roseateles saccharophilus]TCU85471.1 nitroreductase [Roseateles saccharophilus]
MNTPEHAALQALLGRHSVGPKHLVEPGPGDEQLALMVQAALHAPDHAELVPYRFKLVRGAAKEGMAALFADAARAAGKGEEGAALDAERALRPPLTVAVVARIDLGHPQVPAHEQWAAVGGAISNFLTAAHLLGFGGKMLSGAKVRNPAIAAAFCAPGETLVGWIALGTPVRRPAGPSRKPGVDEVLLDWPAAARPS